MAAKPAEQTQTKTSSIRGLSEAEAQARRARGQGNRAEISTSRSYRDIIQQNVINLINVILFVIGAVMIAIGRTSDAVVSVGLITLNAVIGIAQEIRAKRQLDQIALLTRPRVTILREGVERVVDPSEVVLGDVLVAKPGDQIVVDGRIVGANTMEVDESLLTGESDLVRKEEGAEVYSGSFCVNGTAYYEATKVGAEAYANQLTASARQYRVTKTPLQREIDFVIRLLMLLALFLGFLLLISAFLSSFPIMRTVQMAAVIAGLVPNGLFFMVIVAYAMGALRIVQRGALVQQSNSVESLSNVDVLCMDKTGTLTANRILFHEVKPLGMEREALLRALGIFARSGSTSNRTSEALAEGVPGAALAIVDEVPFSSERKWSALAFEQEEMRGVYALGALEFLQPYLRADGEELTALAREWTQQGLRVLLFAHNGETSKLHDSLGNPGLPELVPIGLVAFSDELRPELQETLRGFREAGVQLKIISGDNPETVAALARQAGFDGDLRLVSGPEIEQMDDAALALAAEEGVVFGRITPQQKERLVDALRAQGHYVAMMGDGVNDVLSLKKANLGIAMQSGSAATRGVADIVLLGDSFGALPPAFKEGQRIVNGMQDILRLFLTRALAHALLILATAVIGLGFPFVPKHASLIALLTVGVPTFGLALWARGGNKARQGLIRIIVHFVLPAAATIFAFGLLVYVFSFTVVAFSVHEVDVTPEMIEDFVRYTGINYDLTRSGGTEAQGFLLELATLSAQTSLTTFSMLAGLVLVLFVEPPARWAVAGDSYSGDWRPGVLAGLMLLVYIFIVLYEPAWRFFELVPLPAYVYAAIAGFTVVWALLLRQMWRGHWLERFFNIEPLRPDIDWSADAQPEFVAGRVER